MSAIFLPMFAICLSNERKQDGYDVSMSRYPSEHFTKWHHVNPSFNLRNV